MIGYLVRNTFSIMVYGVLDHLRTLEVLKYYGSCHIAVEVMAV